MVWRSELPSAPTGSSRYQGGSQAESESVDAGESPEPPEPGASIESADAESPEPSPTGQAEGERFALVWDAGEEKYEEDFDDESLEDSTGHAFAAETPEISGSPHGSAKAESVSPESVVHGPEDSFSDIGSGGAVGQDFSTLPEKPRSARSVESLDEGELRIADDLALQLSRELVQKSTESDHVVQADVKTNAAEQAEAERARAATAKVAADEATADKAEREKSAAEKAQAEKDAAERVAAEKKRHAAEKAEAASAQATPAKPAKPGKPSRAEASHSEEVRMKAREALLSASDDGSLYTMLSASQQKAQTSDDNELRKKAQAAFVGAANDGSLLSRLTQSHVQASDVNEDGMKSQAVVPVEEESARPKSSDSLASSGVVDIAANSPDVADDAVDDSIRDLIDTSVEEHSYLSAASPENAPARGVSKPLEFKEFKPDPRPPSQEPAEASSAVVQVTHRIMNHVVSRMETAQTGTTAATACREASKQQGQSLPANLEVKSHEPLREVGRDDRTLPTTQQPVKQKASNDGIFPNARFAPYYQTHVLPGRAEMDFLASFHHSNFERADKGLLAAVPTLVAKVDEQDTKTCLSREMQEEHDELEPDSAELAVMRKKLTASLVQSWKEGNLDNLLDSFDVKAPSTSQAPTSPYVHLPSVAQWLHPKPFRASRARPCRAQATDMEVVKVKASKLTLQYKTRKLMLDYGQPPLQPSRNKLNLQYNARKLTLQYCKPSFETRTEAEAELSVEADTKQAFLDKQRAVEAEAEAAREMAEKVAREIAESEAQAAIKRAEAEADAARERAEAAAQAARKRAEAEQEAKQKAEEEARIQSEEEARRRAEEEARVKAEKEARVKAEEEARQKAEEEARAKAEGDLRQKAETEARVRAEEEARQKAEEEARVKAEKEARVEAEEEARQKAEEEARVKVEEEARQKAEEEARHKAEEEQRKQAALRIQRHARGMLARDLVAVEWGSETVSKEAADECINRVERQVATVAIQSAARQKAARKEAAKQREQHELEEAAAVSVQCALRQKAARKEVAKQREQHQSEEAAAVSVQCAVRQKAARKEVAKQREQHQLEEAAAVSVQCAMRQKAARKEVTKQREQHQLEEAAAVSVQCAMRQKAARKEVAKQREQHQLEEAAAVSVQCAMRQKAARKEVAKQRQHHELEDRAAVSVQCAMRQKAARKEVAKQREQHDLEAARLRADLCNEALRAIAEQAIRNANAAVNLLATSACKRAVCRAQHNVQVRETRRQDSATKGAQAALSRLYDNAVNAIATRTYLQSVLSSCSATSECRQRQLISRSTALTRESIATREGRENLLEAEEEYLMDLGAQDFSKRVVLNSCRQAENRQSRCFSRGIVLKSCRHAQERESRVFTRSVVEKSCLHSEDRLARTYSQRLVLMSCHRSQNRAAQTFSKSVVLKCSVKPTKVSSREKPGSMAEHATPAVAPLPLEQNQKLVETVTQPETSLPHQHGGVLSVETARAISPMVVARAVAQSTLRVLVQKPCLTMPRYAWEHIYKSFAQQPRFSATTLPQESLQSSATTLTHESPESSARALPRELCVFAATESPQESLEPPVRVLPDESPKYSATAVPKEAPDYSTRASWTALLTMPRDAWENIYKSFVVPERSSRELPLQSSGASQGTPFLTLPKEDWEQIYKAFIVAPNLSSSTSQPEAAELPSNENEFIDQSSTGEAAPLTAVSGEEVALFNDGCQLPNPDWQVSPEAESTKASKEENPEGSLADIVPRSLGFDELVAATSETETQEAPQKDLGPSAPAAVVEEMWQSSWQEQAPAASHQEHECAVLIEPELSEFHSPEPHEVSEPKKAASFYHSEAMTDITNLSDEEHGGAGQQNDVYPDDNMEMAAPERADITYYVTLYEERLARAVLSGEFEPEYCSRSASRPRFRRPAPGYMLRQHHNREEARVASFVYGKDLTADSDVATAPALVDEQQTKDADAESLQPQKPAGPSPKARRPGPRRAKPLEPPTLAADVEAWTPLRGSDSTAQLVPKAPDEPRPVEGGRRPAKLRKPRQQGTPATQSRFVFSFPVTDEKAPTAVSADDVAPTVRDDDTMFRATVSSLRSTGDVSSNHSVPPLRVRDHQHTTAWSSDWVLQNSKPWPPRYHIGLPPLSKESASDGGDSPACEEDLSFQAAATIDTSELASRLDGRKERGSLPSGHHCSDGAISSVRPSFAGELSARPSHASLSPHTSTVEVTPSSERARIHLPPVRQMRFAPLTLKSKRESSCDHEAL